MNAIKALDRYFQISKQKTTIGTEIRAGLATFLTMAYILFVNPSILSKAIHLPPEASGFAQMMSATALAAALGTLIMGLYARYPFATAPGMGLNAFFTYTLVIHHKLPWQTALGCVFFSGLIAVVISLFGLRESIIRAFPLTLKRATSAGIGLFLAFIGLSNSGLVVDHPQTLVTLGSFHNPSVLLSLLGLFVTAIFVLFKVKGAILIGIFAVTLTAIASGLPVYQGQSFGGFDSGLIMAPVWPRDLFFSLDLKSAFSLGLLTTILSMFFVDFFDTAGTLVGLADRAGFTDKNGNLPRGSKAFVADGLASTFGALVGTSSTTTYVESMAGIEEGGKTGMTSIVVSLLFLASLFLWPLASAVPAAATAPALLIIGSMMVSSAVSINWNDPSESIPAFLTMITMPLTYSIAHGIAFGIISYTVMNAFGGRIKKLHPVMYVLTLLLALKYGLEGT